MKLKRIETKRKKAQSMLDVFIFLVVAFIIIFLFLIWKYGVNVMSNALTSIETPKNDIGVNVSDVAQKTFGNLNAGVNVLNLVGLCLIVGMILSIFLSYFIVKSHPVFFVGFLFITILAIILSAYISNVYQDMMVDTELGATLVANRSTTTIMLNLPIWVTVIGLIGAVVLFSGIMSDRGAGGGFV